ncbi:MAG TPA: sigma-70 family RNA polymerase sigma factor, partial [Kofleriaceae bacterium]|nr:sigma-70 family RNA polymerase sigma factor [Kofleriaceae bacterium]
MDELLLAEMIWVRRLARALLRDVDAADDVAQDAWLVASKHAPDDRPLRPWLARVVLNLVRMRGRGATRRQLRELATGDDAQTVPTSEELVERVEMQRVVAAEVVALAEPSRQTILLRYVEGLPSAEIARRLGIPDATVRRRLKRALDELRERLRARDDAPSGGWLAALAPLAQGPVAVGALTMKKLIAIVVAIVLMLLIAGGVWHARANRAARDNGGGSDIDRIAQGSTAALDDPHHRRDRDATIGVPSWAAQAGVAPRRIAGRVVLGTMPVPDAIVRLGVNVETPGARIRRNLGIRPLTQVAVMRTSPAGTFDFGVQPAAAYVVSAEAANASPASIVFSLADPRAAPPPDHLVIALGDCRSRMAGMVRDSANGIGHARLRVAGLGGTESDPSGHYTLCVPAMSDASMLTGVRVDADGYGTIDVLLPSLYGDMHQDFVLVPEATIAGSVVDEAGAPVAAAGISARPILGDDRHDTAIVAGIADADGHFQLSGVAPGAYHLSARGDRAATATPTLVVTTAGTSTRDLRLVVNRRARLRGRVMMAGTPVAGATVGADRTSIGGNDVATAISQRDGSFILDDLALGVIVPYASPYQVRTPTSVVVDRTDPADITIEVAPKGTIRGHVTRHHAPVVGARVSCSFTDSCSAFTDEDGAYTLEGVPDGTGYLDAGSAKAWVWHHPVTVIAGQSQT